MKLLVLADIHANLPALEAVLNREGDFDEVLFLGDAIGAGPHPDGVLTLLSELRGIWIVGNHDLEPFRRRFHPDETDPDRIYMQWTGNQISPQNRCFLERFEPTRVVKRQGLVLRLHHGDFVRKIDRVARSRRLPRVIRGCVRRYAKRFLPRWESRFWPDTDPRNYATLAREYREPYILFGHSHIQFRLKLGPAEFVNPGSVGQPRLGKPLANYAVLQEGQVALKAVPYDTEATCRALDRIPLDRDYLESWKAGYRAGTLPERYKIRDWRPLIDQGYR